MIHNMKNKVIKIDGAPGITLEGVRGSKGRKGGMIFFTDDLRGLDPFSIFDMWSSETVTKSPISKNTSNYCEYATPEKYDYIVSHTQSMAYVYIVEIFIPKEDVVDRNRLEKYVESKEITKEYADNIFNYYNQHLVYDCCFVKRISALNTALFSEIGNLHTFDVTVSSDDISYNGYSGSIHADGDAGKAFMIEKTVKCLNFVVTAESREEFDGVRIEADFYRKNINGEMHGITPSLWSTLNPNMLNINYPAGYLNNYSYTLNYDDEILDNFTVVIKDYDDMPQSAVFESYIKIPETMVLDYSVCLYAYCTTISGIEKIYIGDLDLSVL